MVEEAEKFKLPAGLTPLKGEKIVFYGRLSFLASFFGSIVWVLLGFVLIFLGVIGKFPLLYFVGLFFILGIPLLKIYASEYMISNRRVYVKFGLISRRITEARLEWVTDVHIDQGIFGRIFNYGNIIFATPSGPLTSVVMEGVSDPLRVRTIVLDWIKKAKESEKIKKKLEDLEKEYELGRVDEKKYKELKEKYEKELSALESD